MQPKERLEGTVHILLCTQKALQLQHDSPCCSQKPIKNKEQIKIKQLKEGGLLRLWRKNKASVFVRKREIHKGRKVEVKSEIIPKSEAGNRTDC